MNFKTYDERELLEMLNRLGAEERKILFWTLPDLIENHQKFREIYWQPYDWPELDLLRGEICHCLFFGCFQGAMTLTNHFLENLLKTALITKAGIERSKTTENQGRQNAINHFKQHYGPGFAEFDKLYLGDIIDRAFQAELITKEQKDQLLVLKDIYRNAWSHSNKQKMFGESITPIIAAHFGDEEIKVEAQEDVKVADFIIGQGFFQAELARREAPRYFAYVDGIARQICIKLFGENYRSKPGGKD